MNYLEKFNSKDVGKTAKVTDPAVAKLTGDHVTILEVGHSARAGYCVIKDEYGAEGWIRNDRIRTIKEPKQ